MIIGLTIPLFVLEYGLRAFGPIIPGSYSIGLYLEHHPVYGRFHIPNTTSWLRTDEYLSRVDINSHGLREREIGYDKPAGTTRILVLGDSFVEGAEVPVEATLTRRLEALLLDQGNGPVQVINAGIRGFGTAQEYLFLKNEGLRYHPDLVVTAFYIGNDLANNSHQMVREDRPYFVLEGSHLRQLPFEAVSPETEGVVQWLRRNSLLFGALDTGPFARLRVSRLGSFVTRLLDGEPKANSELASGGDSVFQANPTGPLEESWRVTEALLVAMRDEAEAAGVPFLLVGVPTKYEVYPEDWVERQQSYRLRADAWDLDGPNRRLAGLAERRGISYLDLRPALTETAGTRGRLYYRANIHWTAEGHDVAAKALARKLRDLDFRPTAGLGRSAGRLG